MLVLVVWLAVTVPTSLWLGTQSSALFLLFIFGIERPTHRLAGVARLVGWVSMFVFTLVPTSLLFLPLLVVLLALPAVFEARLSPRPGREASGSLAPGPR